MPLFWLIVTPIVTALGNFFTQTAEFFVKKLGWQLGALAVAAVTFAAVFIGFVGATNLVIPTLPNFMKMPFSWVLPESTQVILGSVVSLRVVTKVVLWKISFLKSVADVLTH
jgi:hypothetical protein